MIPARFVFLASIPLTPGGKVDRRALPAPEEFASIDAERAGDDTLEGRLGQIWEELLGVHPIGADDNFFDLGGHSLLAVRLMHRIELATGERLALSAFLAGPTIRRLARALVEQRTGADRPLLVQVQPGAGRPPFFYLHGDVENGGFYCLRLARCLGADRPFYALAPHGLNGAPAPPTVEAMAASYIEMLRAVQPEGPYFLGGICNGGIVAFEIARQLERQGSRVAQVVAVAARARTALYRRALDRLIAGAGRWIGFGPEKRLSLFLAVRARGHRLRDVYRNFLHRAGLGPRFPKRLLTTRSAGREPFERALDGYLPRPYSGRLLVLWPVEEPFDTGRDPTVGWGAVASRLRVTVVPGGHVTCVRDHLPMLADHIKTSLDEAEKNG